MPVTCRPTPGYPVRGGTSDVCECVGGGPRTVRLSADTGLVWLLSRRGGANSCPARRAALPARRQNRRVDKRAATVDHCGAAYRCQQSRRASRPPFWWRCHMRVDVLQKRFAYIPWCTYSCGQDNGVSARTNKPGLRPTAGTAARSTQSVSRKMYSGCIVNGGFCASSKLYPDIPAISRCYDSHIPTSHLIKHY